MADQTVNFNSLFRVNPDESIEPLKQVSIGGVQFGPGVSFSKGVFFSGIDLTQHVGKDFLVDDINGISIIKGIF